LENVANILRLGGTDVVGSLAQIGYDCEWTIISARQFGAPHIRKRWFSVAYPMPQGLQKQSIDTITTHRKTQQMPKYSSGRNAITNTNGQRSTKQYKQYECMEKKFQSERRGSKNSGINNGNSNYWCAFPTQSPLCRRNDGIPNRVDRIRALGNAVVPQCAEWIGQQIINSNLLEVACSTKN